MKLTKSQKLAKNAKLNTIIDRTKKHCVGEEKVLNDGFDGIKNKASDLELDTTLITECAKLQKDIHAKLTQMIAAYEKVAQEGDEAVDANDEQEQASDEE